MRGSYQLTCKLERVALYLLEPCSGADTDADYGLGDAIRAGLAS